ncbi:prolipoprotein diacylglyceryl transferase [Candidatus Uhrbacteria bacterium]|nr:prolipoprotein diacylglyceryl transferase [Candidatus Uhrbacteria bacterium]
MIPWIESQFIQLGPITLRTWGTFVACGFIIGAWTAARRAKKNNVDPKKVWDISIWLFMAAFIGARIFHVFVYEPGYYLMHPWEALDPRLPGYAIYGGFIACAITFLVWIKKNSLDFIQWADTLIWGLPIGCGIGRIGCFLIHDHPGTLSNSLLTVNYPDGQSRHDLGLYLSITGFVIALIFLFFDRKVRHPGFWFGLFLILDSASRLWLDFYRIADVRYSGLTPTQWITIPLIVTGCWIISRTKTKK